MATLLEQIGCIITPSSKQNEGVLWRRGERVPSSSGKPKRALKPIALISKGKSRRGQREPEEVDEDDAGLVTTEPKPTQKRGRARNIWFSCSFPTEFWVHKRPSYVHERWSEAVSDLVVLVGIKGARSSEFVECKKVVSAPTRGGKTGGKIKVDANRFFFSQLKNNPDNDVRHGCQLEVRFGSKASGGKFTKKVVQLSWSTGKPRSFKSHEVSASWNLTDSPVLAVQAAKTRQTNRRVLRRSLRALRSSPRSRPTRWLQDATAAPTIAPVAALPPDQRTARASAVSG